MNFDFVNIIRDLADLKIRHSVDYGASGKVAHAVSDPLSGIDNEGGSVIGLLHGACDIEA